MIGANPSGWGANMSLPDTHGFCSALQQEGAELVILDRDPNWWTLASLTTKRVVLLFALHSWISVGLQVIFFFFFFVYLSHSFPRLVATMLA